MKTIKLLAISLLAMSCGDNIKVDPDAARPDAFNPPAAPTLGAQIDRMGRPAINTALNSAFVTPAGEVTAKKTAYNQLDNPATWGAGVLATGRSVIAEFAQNLAIIDVLDQGSGGATNGAGNACGNQVLVNGMPAGGGTPNPMSYLTLASILSDDMLYVDTTKTSCNNYLAVEFDVATATGHTQCGGRTPSHDIIDVSYSMLSAGIAGFDLMLMPLVNDGVPKHADVSDTEFPFLGAP